MILARQCCQANILPLAPGFQVNDLVLVFKIIHCFTQVTFLAIFLEQAVDEKTHNDRLSLVIWCSLFPSTSNSSYLEIFKLNPLVCGILC